MIAVGSGGDNAEPGDTFPVPGVGLTTPSPRPTAPPTVCPHCHVECHASRKLTAHITFYCRALHGRNPLSPLNPHYALERRLQEGPTT